MSPLPPVPSFLTQNFTVYVAPETADGETMYVGQCAEYDICVQGRTLDQVRERFVQAIFGHIMISRKRGVTPFASLPPGKVEPQTTGTRARGRYPVTPPRNRIPAELQDDYAWIPRGEITLSVA